MNQTIVVKAAALEQDAQDAFAAAGPSIRRILYAVAEHMGMPDPWKILVRRTKPDLVKARAIAAFVARQSTDLSYPAISKRLGGFDHSTIMRACGFVTQRHPEDIAAVKEILGLEFSTTPGGVLPRGFVFWTPPATPDEPAICERLFGPRLTGWWIRWEWPICNLHEMEGPFASALEAEAVRAKGRGPSPNINRLCHRLKTSGTTHFHADQVPGARASDVAAEVMRAMDEIARMDRSESRLPKCSKEPRRVADILHELDEAA